MPSFSRRDFVVSLPAVGISSLLACSQKAGSIEPGREVSHPFRADDGLYSCYRTPALVITRHGAILAFCGGRLDHCGDEGNIDVVLRRSLDGGRNWTSLQVLANDGANPCKIPIPVVLAGGRILLLWLWNASVARKMDRGKRQVQICQSDDDGLSWSAPRDITDQVRLAGWSPWYGIGPGHGIVKSLNPAAGRIVIPARHHCPGQGSQSHLVLSDDGGQTWRVGAVAPYSPSNECSVAELGDGSLMLNSRSRGGFRVVSISRDGGLSMASSQPDPQLVEPEQGCQGSLLTYAIHTNQTAELLFFNPADRKHRTNGRLRLSRDNGRSWSRGFGTDLGLGSFSGYSDLARFADGDVALLVETGPTHLKRKQRFKADGQPRKRREGITFQRIPFRLLQI